MMQLRFNDIKNDALQLQALKYFKNLSQVTNSGSPKMPRILIMAIETGT